jgi:hypothetical protein
MLGTAIRMAYDLGLHREYTPPQAQPLQVDQTELRRRVWAGLVIADRWISAMVRSARQDFHVDALMPRTVWAAHGHRPRRL